jgi:cytochrome c553
MHQTSRHALLVMTPTTPSSAHLVLDGPSAVYIKAQLQALSTGTRHNDVSEQMRSVARPSSPLDRLFSVQY